MLCDFLELSECLGQGIHALALSWVLLLGVCSGLMCGLSTTSNGCVSLKAVPRRQSFYLIIVWQGLQIWRERYFVTHYREYDGSLQKILKRHEGWNDDLFHLPVDIGVMVYGNRKDFVEEWPFSSLDEQVFVRNQEDLIQGKGNWERLKGENLPAIRSPWAGHHRCAAECKQLSLNGSCIKRAGQWYIQRTG